MGKAKPASGSIIRIYPDASAYVFYNELADGKSQSCSLCTFIQLFKAVEDFVLLFRRYAAAGIGNREKGGVFGLQFQLEGNASFWSKLGGVNQQID